MEKVSIIVPVYNAKSSIGYCINSITSQTYTNLEIILVNDGSTDNSLQICKNYAKIDNRIRVIDKENGGVSHARNTGLSYATGTYIEFVDSDDCLSLDMVEKMVETIECYKTDLVICGFKIIELKDQLPTNILHCTSSGLGKTCVLTQKNFFDHFAEILWKTATLEGPTNKLYQHAIIKKFNLKFSEDLSLGEDFLFNMNYFDSINNGIVFLSEELYFYLQTNLESLTHKYRPDLFENELLLINQAQTLLSNHPQTNIADKKYLYDYILSKTIFCIKDVISADSFLSDAQIKQALAEIINTDIIRSAIENSDYVDPQFEWIRDVYIFSDIETLYTKTKELLSPNIIANNTQDTALSDSNVSSISDESIQKNPGMINRLLVRFLTLFLNIYDSTSIRSFKDNVSDYGIKIALKKVTSF